MNINATKAFSLDDAWRTAMTICIQRGHDYIVEGGSYMGQIRRQLKMFAIEISNPGSRPLAPILPPSIPAPTSEDKICEYFICYIVGTEKAENEDYTYGQFIAPQMDRILELLRSSGGYTNQATINIGNEWSSLLDDPPCLRCISFKVVDRYLDMFAYFRSWDLFGAFSENLGGLQLLKELVLTYLSLNKSTKDVRDGSIYAVSDGLHLYEQYFNLADCLNTSKIVLSTSIMEKKKRYEEENGI